jgi:hypothetical protein
MKRQLPFPAGKDNGRLLFASFLGRIFKKWICFLYEIVQWACSHFDVPSTPYLRKSAKLVYI